MKCIISHFKLYFYFFLSPLTSIDAFLHALLNFLQSSSVPPAYYITRTREFHLPVAEWPARQHYGVLSRTWRKFDPDTAYVVCISVSRGFRYPVSKSLDLPYMVMLQTYKRKRRCSGYGVALSCYGRCIVPGAAIVTSQILWLFTQSNGSMAA